MALSNAHRNIKVAFTAEGDPKKVTLLDAMHSFYGDGSKAMRSLTSSTATTNWHRNVICLCQVRPALLGHLRAHGPASTT